MNKNKLYENIMRNVANNIENILNENSNVGEHQDEIKDALKSLAFTIKIEPSSIDFKQAVMYALNSLKKESLKKSKITDNLKKWIIEAQTEGILKCVDDSGYGCTEWYYLDFLCYEYETLNLPSILEDIEDDMVCEDIFNYTKGYKKYGTGIFRDIWNCLPINIKKEIATIIEDTTLRYFDGNTSASYEDYC